MYGMNYKKAIGNRMLWRIVEGLHIFFYLEDCPVLRYTPTPHREDHREKPQ